MNLRPYLYAFVLMCLGACSWIVSPEQGPIKCKVEKGSNDPCPRNMACVGGDCVAEKDCKNAVEVCNDGVDNDCDNEVDEAATEECNQKDDDCDGNTDEGFDKKKEEACDRVDEDCDGLVDEDFDQDDDGVTSCGDFMRAGTFDCEPFNKNAYPGFPEQCDGLDNDCDGNTDEDTTSMCPANQLCGSGACVAKTCAVEGSGVVCQANERCIDDRCVKMNCGMPCKEGQYCDPATNQCADVPQARANGQMCTVDTDCLSLHCFDSAALKLPATPRRVCGKACCADSDCGAGETCFASGTGARSCLPKTLAYNAGTAPACTGSDNCAATTTCAAGESVQGPGTRKFSAPVCLAAPAPAPPLLGPRNVPYGEQCNNWSSCLTRICLPLIFSRVCTAPCRTSADCTKLHDYNNGIIGYCQYVDLGLDNDNDTTNVPGGSFAPVCLARYPELEGAVPTKTPASCRTNADCPDSTCIGASTLSPNAGQCAPTCCKDAHCASRPEARCIPVARGADRYEMRCVQ